VAQAAAATITAGSVACHPKSSVAMTTPVTPI
jgi:hypothetical protein